MSVEENSTECSQFEKSHSVFHSVQSTIHQDKGAHAGRQTNGANYDHSHNHSPGADRIVVRIVLSREHKIAEQQFVQNIVVDIPCASTDLSAGRSAPNGFLAATSWAP